MKRCTHPPELEAAVKRVRACFPTSTDLLSKQYRKAQRATVSEGFCSVASEAVWQDAQRYGYKGRNASWHEPSGERFSHWWLVSPDDCILDPTADQFSAEQLRKIYAAGKPGGFPGIRKPEGVPVVGSKARKLRERAGLGAEQMTFDDYLSERGRLTDAMAFDPQSPYTKQDYTTQAYPSARGREMGLGCGIFRVVLWDEDGALTASAIRSDGVKMGQAQAYVRRRYLGDEGDTKTLSVTWSSLLQRGRTVDEQDADPGTDFRRCGVGARLYEAFAKYACDHGLVMTSDDTLSSNSKRFWQKQVEKGRAYRNDSGLYVVSDACQAARGMNGIRKRKRTKRRKR